MAIAIDITKEYPAQEVSSVIKSALTRDASIASYKEKRYMGICKRFEKKYGMGSDEFMDKLESGMLDDRDDYFDWFAAKRGLDIWSRRLRILSGVNL
ncbi:MAG: hypothetical protein C4B59_14715 [Candidatus Methanogaster sp.]|uniref:Uncharacterized protein n=1 Tax=Candidatus Methanogaster sp. TaxID=3386292 RepID=A0AC61KZP5_9EURY|nr:MAG: hypothetical protein C4B59_14715 [ANME-2 cluster archaeon]